MNQQKAALFLPLITALAEGKTIQISQSGGTWSSLPNPTFTSPFEKYRIKPREPEKLFMVADRDGTWGKYDTLEEAEKELAAQQGNRWKDYKIYECVEVIPS